MHLLGDEEANARAMLAWAVGIEANPLDASKEDVLKANAILFYYDKWRTVIYHAAQLKKATEE